MLSINLNSVIINEAPVRTVTHLLCENWIAAVAEEISSNPAGIAFSVEPDVCGRYDCQMGLPCDPYERGYRRLADVEAYCIAWHDTTALWAEMVAAKNDEAAYDYDGALQELVDGMEDEDYWRRGC